MVVGSLLVAGRYRVGRRLAAGGISHVWLATDESDGSTVAIKRCAVPAGLSETEGELVRELSLREARAFARVVHPNVVRIRDVVPDDGEPWIVMDYIPSRSLQEVVSSSGAMHPRRVAEIGLQMLQGLVGVFDAGVLHLDVKPGNVLIADDGRVLLSDFGPAVTEEGVQTLTDAGIVLGSLNYVAPERLFDGISTQRADLWSFGATLYFAVEGRRPFRRDTKDETMAALRGRTPDPLLRAGALTEVICGLMRADPEDRLSVAAAERQLRGIAGKVAEPPARIPQQRAAESTVPDPLPGPALGIFRRPVPVAAAVAAAAVAAIGITAAVRQGDETGVRSAAPPAPAVSSAVAPPVFRLPSGYSWRSSEAGGFRVAMPSRWTVEEAGGVFTASGPKGGPLLRVRVWSPRAANAVGGLIDLESRTKLDNYQRVRIEASADRPGTVWEYTYRSGTGKAFRAQDQTVTAGDRTYLMTWLCPREQWSEDLGAWSTVLDSFGPLSGA
jgi:tRNA A-37 threonylcarbamoyl transferase component Bud32